MKVHEYEELFYDYKLQPQKESCHLSIVLSEPNSLYAKEAHGYSKWLFSADYILRNCMHFLLPQGHYLLSFLPGGKPLKGLKTISFVFQGK